MPEERFLLEPFERTFAQTRLTPPLLANQLLERPRLLRQLEEAVFTHRLTLISAPAGSGKTTLAASLTSNIDYSDHVAYTGSPRQ